MWTGIQVAPVFSPHDHGATPRLPAQGMDLELHTHRHRLPIGDSAGIKNEIIDNRVVLERMSAGPPASLLSQWGISFFPISIAASVWN